MSIIEKGLCEPIELMHILKFTPSLIKVAGAYENEIQYALTVKVDGQINLRNGNIIDLINCCIGERHTGSCNDIVLLNKEYK